MMVLSREMDIEKRPLWALAAFRTALTCSRLLAGLDYQGQENLPQTGGFVLAANHQSYLDGMWILGGLSAEQFERSTALAGADLSVDHGLIGRLIMKIGRPISIERYGNPVRGLIAAKRALQSDQIVLVHPEGTRTHNGFLAPLLSGTAYLGIKAGVPIIPVYLSGAYDFFPRHAKRPHLKIPRTGRRPNLTVRYLEPIYALSSENANAVSAKIAAALYAAETDWLESSEGWAASLAGISDDWTRGERPSLESLVK